MFVNEGEIRFSIFHASSSTLVYPNELHRDLGQKINEGGFPSCVKGQGYEFEFKIFQKPMISKMLKNLTSISPYNKVIHKGPHKLGVRTASFAKTGDQMTKSKEKDF
jgi:hypothetical protein